MKGAPGERAGQNSPGAAAYAGAATGLRWTSSVAGSAPRGVVWENGRREQTSSGQEAEHSGRQHVLKCDEVRVAVLKLRQKGTYHFHVQSALLKPSAPLHLSQCIGSVQRPTEAENVRQVACTVWSGTGVTRRASQGPYARAEEAAAAQPLHVIDAERGNLRRGLAWNSRSSEVRAGARSARRSSG